MNTPVRQQGRANIAPAAGGSSGAGTITKAQRAAVVIAMMGEAAARPIVSKLDDRAMAKVSAALRSIQYLDRAQLAEIVIDFLQHLRSQDGSFRGGPNRAREIIASLLDENRLGKVFGDLPVDEEDDMPALPMDDTWGRLEREPPAKTAEYLNSLTPNLIAIVLRQLDPSVASEIVAQLEDGKLDPTIGALVETDHVDPEIESVVSRMIRMQFLNQSNAASAEEDNSHLEAVGELLSLVPAGKRDRLMTFLKSEHGGKLESIERQIFTIDSLPEILPRSGVPTVFRELDETTLVTFLATLKGDTAKVQEYLLGNISSRLADQFRDLLGDVKPVSPEQAEAIQRDFLMAIMTLKRDGVIALQK